MGSPHVYYKKALQCFACYLTYMEDFKLAKTLYQEESEEKLEEFILKKKETVSEKEFYYQAGRSCQDVLYSAEEEGTDQYNASFDGLLGFEDFIGLEPYDDKEEE